MSNTQLESNLKWDLYCNIDHSMRRWSLGATVTTLAFWVRYCLKGNSNTIKAITGILYTTNIANIYILGQYFGIFLNLKDGLNGQCVDTNYKLGYQMEQFLVLFRERNEARDRGEKVMRETEFKTQLCTTIIENSFLNDEGTQEKPRSMIKNSYFADNYDKYAKRSLDDDDPTRIFVPDHLRDSHDDKWYSSNFVLKYAVLGSHKWITNVGKFLGVLKD